MLVGERLGIIGSPPRPDSKPPTLVPHTENERAKARERERNGNQPGFEIGLAGRRVLSDEEEKRASLKETIK